MLVSPIQSYSMSRCVFGYRNQRVYAYECGRTSIFGHALICILISIYALISIVYRRQRIGFGNLQCCEWSPQQYLETDVETYMYACVFKYMHTHTQIHTHTHTRTHMHTNIYTRTYTNTCTHTHAHAHAITLTNAHAHIDRQRDIQMRVHTLMTEMSSTHIYAKQQDYTQPFLHTSTHPCLPTLKVTHIHMSNCAQMQSNSDVSMCLLMMCCLRVCDVLPSSVSSSACMRPYACV